MTVLENELLSTSWDLLVRTRSGGESIHAPNRAEDNDDGRRQLLSLSHTLRLSRPIRASSEEKDGGDELVSSDLHLPPVTSVTEEERLTRHVVKAGDLAPACNDDFKISQFG